MHYNRGSLPYPVDQLVFPYLDQIPAPPQTPSAQQLPMDLAMELNVQLIGLIQSSVQRGPLRVFMFNLMADNAFNNRAYVDLFDATCQYALALMVTNSRIDPPTIAKDAILAEIPAMVDQYPDLWQYIPNDARRELTGYQQLGREIAMFVEQSFGQPQQQGGWQGGGGGWSAPPQSTWGNGPQSGFNQQSRPPMGAQRSWPAPNHRSVGGQVWQGHGNSVPSNQRPPMGRQHQNVPSPNRPSASGMVRSPEVTNESASHLTRHPRQSMTSTLDTTQSKPSIHPAGEQSMRYVPQADREIAHHGAIVEARSQKSANRPSTPPIERRNGGVVLETYTHYAPAITSGQIVTESKNDDDEVVFTVIEKDPNMDYTDHETNQAMLNLARASRVGPKIVPRENWPLVSRPNEVHTDDSPEDTNELEISDPVILVTAPISSFSVAQGRVEALKTLKTKGIEDVSQRVYEYYLGVITPIPASADEVLIVKDVINASDAVTFYDRLVTSAESLEATLWHYINDVATRTMNRMLKGSVGTDWHIQSFSDDYDDAMGILRDVLSDSGLDRFKSHLLTQLKLSLMAAAEEQPDAVYFKELVSVTHLPWSSQELDIQLPKPYSLLTELNVDMLAAVNRLFERTNTDNCSVARRFMVTADNRVIEVHAALLGANNYLISKGPDLF